MKKTDIGMGLGAATLLAVCCGGHLVLLALVGAGVAILTAQTLLIAPAVLVVIALAIYVWRRRSAKCAESTCSP